MDGIESAKGNVKESKPKRVRPAVVICVCAALIAAALTALCFTLWRRGNELFPTVTIETPEKLSASEREPFALKLYLTALSDASYPAASFSIKFDPARLEFLGLEEGNVLLSDAETSSGVSLPDWNVNVERSNRNGVINIMFLDTEVGKRVFTKENLHETENVLLLLKFRLRGGAVSGDIIGLTIEDAIFAAVDESQSLARSTGTLRTNDARIVIGD